MHRLLMLMLLMVLVAIGAWAWFARTGTDAVPMVPLVPAQPVPPPDGKGPNAPNTEPGAGTAVPATANRTAAAPQAAEPTDRPARLDVRVVLAAAGTGANDEPLADIDVGVAVAASEKAPAWSELRRTDHSGRASFVVPAGDARSAQVWSGFGAGVGGTRLSAAAPAQVTLRIAARCQVEGLVVDAAGRGIAGAELVFLPWLGRSSAGLSCAMRVATSGSDGSFRVGLSTGGQLGALHRDYAPSVMRTVQPELDRSKPPATTTLRLALLTLPARARGVVIAADGRPLPRTAIELRAVEGAATRAALSAPPQCCQSDAEGRFSAQHLRPGAIAWVARLPGHGTARGRFEVAADDCAELRIQMGEACDVTGVVRDAGGAPLGGVAVWAGAEGAFDGTTDQSRADGTFVLRDLPPGPTDLSARDGSRRPETARGAAAARLELAPGSNRWNPVLDAADGPVLRGLVVDAAGRPLARWRVLAQQGAASPQQAETNEQGEFAVRAAGQGRFEVRVYSPEPPIGSLPMAAASDVDAAAGVVRIAVDLGRPTGSVRGIVQSNLQEPLAATITCWHHELRAQARAVADRGGAFRIDRVPAGTIDVHVEHAGHAGFSRRELTITAGADHDLGVVQLPKAGAVHGVVTGPDGLAPAQVQISILTADKQLTAEYAAGTYRLAAVPQGKHVLQVQGPGVAATKFALDVPAGAEVQQDIRLERGITRRFKIACAASPSTWVSLALRVPNEAHTWISGQAVRGATAVEFLACMAPGTYEAIAWGSEGWQNRANVVFGPGDESDVHLELQRH